MKQPASQQPQFKQTCPDCRGGAAVTLTSFTGGAGGLQGLAGQLHALRLDLEPHRVLARQHAGDGLPHLGRPRLRPGLPGQAGGLAEGPARGPAAQAGEPGLHDQPLGSCGLHPEGGPSAALLLLVLLVGRGGSGVLVLQPGLGWGGRRAGRAPRSSRARGALCMLLLLLLLWLGRLLLLF